MVNKYRTKGACHETENPLKNSTNSVFTAAKMTQNEKNNNNTTTTQFWDDELNALPRV